MNRISEEQLRPRPPRLDDEQGQLNAALTLQRLAEGIPVKVQVSMDSEPKGANDLNEKSLARAMGMGTRNEQGRRILESLGISPEAVLGDKNRHDDLWLGYEDAKVLRRGGRDGRRICDKFKQTAAAMVDTEAGALLEEMSDEDKSEFISDLRPIENAKVQRLAGQQVTQQKVEKLEEAARERIADVEARRKLQGVMAAMRQGEGPSWDQVMEAVDTYRDLYGDEGEDDEEEDVSPGDRRDRERLH